MRPHLDSRRLVLIAAAPQFTLPAYVAWPLQGDLDLLRTAIETMRQVAAAKA